MARHANETDVDGPVRADLDYRAHLLKHADHIDDLGFDGRVPDRRPALGEHRGKNGVLGRSHGGKTERDVRPLQTMRRLGVVALLIRFDIRPHGAKGIQMNVERPGTDLVAAQDRYVRFARAREERTQSENGNAVFATLRRNVRRADLFGPDRERAARVIDLASDRAAEVGSDGGVPYARKMFERAGFIG